MHKDDEKSLETVTAMVSETFSTPQPRRTVLKGALAGLATGTVLSASTLISPTTAQAHSDSYTAQAKILDIAVTAERLAVTFYSNVIANATALGLTARQRSYLQAALVEEQIHEQFFESLGAHPLTSTFSFPAGASTFTSIRNVIQTQQQLEEMFDSTFLAGVFELAAQSNYRLAQILAQIAVVEGEHRVLGCVIGDQCGLPGYDPAGDRVYAPVLVAKVDDAPAILTNAGYLSPASDNSFNYEPVSITYPGINYHTPLALSD
jgi:hypothetical protein